MKLSVGLTTLLSFLAVLMVSEINPTSKAIIPVAQAQSLSDNPKCSLSTVKGSYAIQLTGWVGSGANRLPYASSGTFIADGKGYLRGVDTVVLDGAPPVKRTVTATYIVDSNTCTGSAVSPAAGNFDFQIIDNGKQITNISTTPGTTVTGISIRQF
ncbi:hypothetical protein NIES2111_55160 [Nostoc sp. NIES-2111]|nr:hypothetical protein NIES2111_55160 [Nostoc sp. NIES-2111]